jgi:hypothetical protein
MIFIAHNECVPTSGYVTETLAILKFNSSFEMEWSNRWMTHRSKPKTKLFKALFGLANEKFKEI